MCLQAKKRATLWAAIAGADADEVTLQQMLKSALATHHVVHSASKGMAAQDRKALAQAEQVLGGILAGKLEKAFKKADSNQDGKLNLKECADVLERYPELCKAVTRAVSPKGVEFLDAKRRAALWDVMDSDGDQLVPSTLDLMCGAAHP